MSNINSPDCHLALQKGGYDSKTVTMNFDAVEAVMRLAAAARAAENGALAKAELTARPRIVEPPAFTNDVSVDTRLLWGE